MSDWTADKTMKIGTTTIMSKDMARSDAVRVITLLKKRKRGKESKCVANI